MQTHHFEFVLHGVGDGGIARIGHDNRRAIGTEQGKELQSGLDRRRRGKSRLSSSERIGFT